MHFLRRTAISFILLAFICCLFSGCSNTSGEKSVEQTMNVATKDVPSSMEAWVGDYAYSEYVPKDQNMFYAISIYKEGNEYLSKINVDGFQTMVRVQAKVLGDGKSIKFVFDQYLPNNQFETFKPGDVLLRFDNQNSEIYTTWEGIKPMLKGSGKSTNMRFKKVVSVPSTPAPSATPKAEKSLPDNTGSNEVTTQNSFSEYTGSWYAEDYKEQKDDSNELVPVGTEMKVDLSKDGRKGTIQLICTSLPPASRIAEVEAAISIGDNNEADFVFDDDGWGNKGTGNIKFQKDKLVVEIKFTDTSGDNWNMFEGAKTFSRKPRNTD